MKLDGHPINWKILAALLTVRLAHCGVHQNIISPSIQNIISKSNPESFDSGFGWLEAKCTRDLIYINGGWVVFPILYIV